MKRFHIHVSVRDLSESIVFYSKLFGTEPSVAKDDYAKWMLDDPRINFAISRRGHSVGVNHLGFQVDSDAELGALRTQVAQAEISALDEEGAQCCYARSDKYWVEDPQGIAWETFHSLGDIPLYGEDAVLKPDADGACCVPAREQPLDGTEACCTPAIKNDPEKAACCG
ncbi:MAG: ArsI/CadI family heavy metal resistance metalloenzyme [Gammaproteobacteria bacterium]